MDGERAQGTQVIAHSEDKIEYARLLKAQGDSLGVIAARTGIPKTSLHRYLAGLSRQPEGNDMPTPALKERESA
jgi:ABC-type transport system involved in cytochrome c biogenesis ATPase subunit